MPNNNLSNWSLKFSKIIWAVTNSTTKPTNFMCHLSLNEKDYLNKLIESLFISNNHRVNLEMVPDLDLINKKEAKLKKMLDSIKSSMSSKEKLDLVNNSKILADRQNSITNKDVLPKLELSDVPKTTSYPKNKKLRTFGYSPTFYEEHTNGLTYNSVT